MDQPISLLIPVAEGEDPIQVFVDSDGDVCIGQPSSEEVYAFDRTTWDLICTFIAAQRAFN